MVKRTDVIRTKKNIDQNNGLLKSKIFLNKLPRIPTVSNLLHKQPVAIFEELV
jgi:hypothetical protein